MHKYHSWTKEEIKTVLRLWESESTETIAEKLGVNKSQVSYIAKLIMKERPELVPKKFRRGKISSLVRDVISSL